MNLQDCIKFANEHPVCYFATIEGNQPRVRVVQLWFADDKGFYFQTQSTKSVCKQLKNNNKVEICFYAPGPDLGTVMRVSGKIEFIDDIAQKNKVLTDRPFLLEMGVKGPEDPLLTIFRVSSGEAYFWTAADSMKEEQIKRIKF